MPNVHPLRVLVSQMYLWAQLIVDQAHLIYTSLGSINCIPFPFNLGKSLFCLPQLSQKSVFSSSTIKPDTTPPSSSKTRHVTSLAISVGVFSPFLWYLFLLDYWKNHSKSQKNCKIENLVLLDSTWLDLYSKHMMWYALVQNICSSFRSIFL